MILVSPSARGAASELPPPRPPVFACCSRAVVLRGESAAMSKFTKADQDALVELCKKPYAMQAKHFLNAFWMRQASRPSPPPSGPAATP